jgi:signal transduction histidine kinase
VLGGLFVGHARAGMFSSRHERLAVGIARWAAVAMDNARLYEAERQLHTESERQRAAAQAASRAKSDFLAVMSHELRTPLNAIAGFTQLLEMGVHGPLTDAQRDVMHRITRNQRHLLGLINDILNLARVEAGQVEYRLADASLAELVAGIGPMIEPQLAAKELAYAVRIAPDCAVRADREKVQQILVNLLANAMKFTPARGRITVDVATRDDPPEAVCLRVRDTGIGIPQEKLGVIFYPFVQVDASRTRTTEGIGLGLAISRDLARGMGGELSVESELGVGSTFTLRLPRATRGPSESAA